MERLAVRLTVRRAEVELVADELFSLGASAVAESPDPDGDGVVLVADLEPAVATGLDRPWRALEPDRAWSEGWRDHARAWRAGPFLVRPPWVPRPPGPGGTGPDTGPVSVELVVDPGDAFGSGSHPTTRLCLEAVARLVAPGSAVLDVGCGSGVLGVGAALLGAAAVVSVDVDPAAVAATARVAAANGVAGAVDVSDRSVAEVPGRFDVVVANLLVGVIEQLGPDIAAHVAPGGAGVLSGLLAGTGQVQRALDAVGLTTERVDELDGWAAVTVRAPATSGEPTRPTPTVTARRGRPSRTPPDP
ncbi:MAG: 50S ribosomal protein L11 methyltransferase [Microthrixaceae bacterium]